MHPSATAVQHRMHVCSSTEGTGLLYLLQRTMRRTRGLQAPLLLDVLR